MSEVLHANIFFIISSIATIVFSILACVLLYQLIRIARAIRRIVDRVEAGAEVLAEDMEQLRSTLNPARLVQFIMSLIPGMSNGSKTRRKRDES